MTTADLAHKTSARASHRRALLALLALPALLGASALWAQPRAGLTDPQATRAVDALVAEAMLRQRLPGVSVAVWRGDRMIVAKGYGSADLAGKTQAAAETIYPLGAISQQFTAAGVLFLAERGRLRLDEPIGRSVPGAVGPLARVRLDQLLRHTGGVREPRAPRAAGAPPVDTDPSGDQLPGLIAREPLGFAPGSRWSYSDTHYVLAARAIESANNEPYEVMLDAVFFQHAGLASLAPCAAGPNGPRMARGYQLRNGQMVPAPEGSPAPARGAAGLCGHAPDLARWARLLARGDLLQPASYAQMTAVTTLADGSRVPYGMGLALLPLDGTRTRIAHNGASAGHQGTLAFYPADNPDEDLAIAVLTNRAGAFTEAIEKAIARRLLNLPAPRIANLPVPQETAARLLGDWDIGVAGPPLTIGPRATGDSRLWLQVPAPGVTSPLQYQGDLRLVAAVAPDAIEVRVLPANEGNSDQLGIVMDGMQWIARRAEASPTSPPLPPIPAPPTSLPQAATPTPAPQRAPPSPPAVPPTSPSPLTPPTPPPATAEPPPLPVSPRAPGRVR